MGIDQYPNLHLVEYDLTDLSSSIRLLQQTEAMEVYNLAAQSFVDGSFDQPITTGDMTGRGLVNPAFVRTNEVKSLCGDAAKLRGCIGGWGTPELKGTLQWMLEGSE